MLCPLVSAWWYGFWCLLKVITLGIVLVAFVTPVSLPPRPRLPLLSHLILLPVALSQCVFFRRDACNLGFDRSYCCASACGLWPICCIEERPCGNRNSLPASGALRDPSCAFLTRCCECAAGSQCSGSPRPQRCGLSLPGGKSMHANRETTGTASLVDVLAAFVFACPVFADSCTGSVRKHFL